MVLFRTGELVPELCSKLKSKVRSERGAYITMMVWLLFAVLMMMALAVDSTLVYLTQMRLKYASQAAAAAGISNYLSGTNYKKSGFAYSTTSATVTDPANPPVASQANEDFAELILAANLGAMYSDSTTETATKTLQDFNGSANASEELRLDAKVTRPSLVMSIYNAFKGSNDEGTPNLDSATTSQQKARLKPAKIVLLLDVSGSMLCLRDGGGIIDPLAASSKCNTPVSDLADEKERRLGALKEAVTSFLEKFNPNNHEIAIVPFSFAAWIERSINLPGAPVVNSASWFDDLASLTAGTYTNISDAFFQAVQSPNLSQRDTIYILFTDGAPQAGRFLFATPRQETHYGSYDDSLQGIFTADINADLVPAPMPSPAPAENDRWQYAEANEFPLPVSGVNIVPPGNGNPFSHQDRPIYLSNGHASEAPVAADDGATNNYDYYHFTEDCRPSNTSDAEKAAHAQYSKPGTAELASFKCPSALIRTPPNSGFKNVFRSDPFFRSWPAGTTECLKRHEESYPNDSLTLAVQGTLGADADTKRANFLSTTINHNCETTWLNSTPAKRPLLWNLFAPCSVHRAAYGKQATDGSWTRETGADSLPISGGAGAPFAFQHCVNDLSFYVPGGGGVVDQTMVKWADYQQIYYNSVIAMADLIRNRGQVLYVIGLGPDPDFSTTSYTPSFAANPSAYQVLDNDFERKDFFLARVALDPFIIPFKYQGQTVGSTTLPDITQNLNFNMDQTYYSWDNTVRTIDNPTNRQSFVGEYIPTDDPNELRTIFDRIARRILLSRLG